MRIRKEEMSDIREIGEITQAAFADHPHSSHTEHFIVDALRRADALALSLVAEVDGRLVGHIAFSAVAISDGSHGWFGLGPVAVVPEMQKRGIGSALINAGLALLRKAGANGCVLLGEPGYYARFGFKNNPYLTLADVPQEYFLALLFTADSARGAVAYHQAFAAGA